MQSIIERIKKGQFWKFHGGIHPPEQKFLTTDKPIKNSALPERLIIPVQQNIGAPGDIQVAVGDYVLKGQALTHTSLPMSVPIHAPTSGHVSKIEKHQVAHPSGLEELCIFIEPDGKDTWRQKNICCDFTQLTHAEIIEKIANAGISGMGGAGFPTHIKVGTKADIEFLIINAAECEPYITADDLLIREHSVKIVEGIKILQHLLNPTHVLIGIEDNKPEAIDILKKVTQDMNDIHVCKLPTMYPTGGEKQLIKVLTGKEVPSATLPSSLGVVMQNVATCFAIAEAVIDDIPLIRRVVTVTGQALAKPQNIWSYIGTPVGHLLDQFGYAPDTKDKRVIMGGPMMGFSLPSDEIPVVKYTNCILTPSKKEISLEQKEVECIRCGQCAEVCPSQLLPQELQWSAKANDHEQLNKLNLFDCIDCGACAYVCPSHIPLVHYYRKAKADIRQKQLAEIKAEKAKTRFEARKARLERDKKEREEKQRLASEARKAAMNAKSEDGSKAKSAVAAALARVKAKKAQQGSDSAPVEPNRQDDKKSQVSEAIARAKAKKAAKAAEQQGVPVDTPADTSEKVETPKSKAVAAAVAKAKAKKAAKAGEQQGTPVETPTDTADKVKTPKSKAVAAAVAKAKAKKLAKSAPSDAEAENAEQAENTDTSTTEAAPRDKATAKKDKVAAAIAKAKAKKQAKAAGKGSSVAPDNNGETDKTAEIKADKVEDTVESPSKKDKIAAAIAKAKAKKSTAKNIKADTDTDTEDSIQVDKSEASINDKPNEDVTSATQQTKVSTKADSTEDKKARVAAAIAKAKAKKNAAKNQQTSVTDANTIDSKPAEETMKEDTQPSDSLSADDKKKARIAAAVAKAKAKKQQQIESN